MNISTRNPLRFPGFAVVVATLFDEILEDYHVFVRNVYFPKENTQPILGSHFFS